MTAGKISPAERLKLIKPSAIRKMIDASIGMKDAIHLEQGEPDFNTPEHIVEAAEKVLKEGHTHYTQTPGTLELREAVSEKLSKENGIDVNPATEVVIVSGTQETMAVTALAFLNPGDKALVFDPYYPAYLEDTLIAEAVPVKVPLDKENDFHVDMEELEKHVDSRTKLIWMCSPCNPTGHVFSKDDMEIIAEVAKKHDLLIFADEIYEKLVYDGTKHLSIGSFPGAEDRTITVNGFSKSHAMTGWRIGYLAAREPLAKELNKLHYYMVLCPNSISQKAALAALHGPQQCIKDMVDEYDRRRKTVMRALDKLPDVKYVKPKGAFYVYPDFSAYEKDDWKLAEHLLKAAHVITVPGTGFGDVGKGHLRISYSIPYEKVAKGMDKIVETLEAM